MLFFLKYQHTLLMGANNHSPLMILIGQYPALISAPSIRSFSLPLSVSWPCLTSFFCSHLPTHPANDIHLFSSTAFICPMFFCFLQIFQPYPLQSLIPLTASQATSTMPFLISFKFFLKIHLCCKNFGPTPYSALIKPTCT